jgi:hypothetical protein
MKKLLIVALLLSGCGKIVPLYGNKDKLYDETAHIYINPIDGIYGQILRNELMNKLMPYGMSSDTEYVLDVETKEPEIIGQGVNVDDNPTLYKMSVEAEYCLLRTVDQDIDKELFCDVAEGIKSYNVLPQIYGTETSEESARKEIMQVIAKDIANRVTIHFKAN